MAKVVLGMTVSLDGFINNRNGSVERLYSDLSNWLETDMGKESIQNTGAVVMGWNSFAMAEDPDWPLDYEYQVPIFVLTHHPPQQQPKETKELTFTFVTDGIVSTCERHWRRKHSGTMSASGSHR